MAVMSANKDMGQKLPSLVIVGRPNVGKSTLFNRLTGTRRAIVTDEPGITRDRIYGKCEWRGRVLEIVDTGGIIPDDKALIPTEILRQARVAIEDAALLVLVVDSTAGLTPLDQELARLLRTTGRPFVVAVNKVDSTLQESERRTVSRVGRAGVSDSGGTRNRCGRSAGCGAGTDQGSKRGRTAGSEKGR